MPNCWSESETARRMILPKLSGAISRVSSPSCIAMSATHRKSKTLRRKLSSRLGARWGSSTVGHHLNIGFQKLPCARRWIICGRKSGGRMKSACPNSARTLSTGCAATTKKVNRTAGQPQKFWNWPCASFLPPTASSSRCRKLRAAA